MCATDLFVKNKLAITLLAAVTVSVTGASLTADTAKPHLAVLEAYGIKPEAILGVDDHGVPIVCGTDLQTAIGLAANSPEPTASLLPAGMRSWECIPNVIRNDGIESFRVEVDVNGSVNRVTFEIYTNFFVTASGSNIVTLRDDGKSGDRVAGDYIFISEPITYRTEVPMPPHQGYTTNSIPGLYMTRGGFVYILETNNTTTQFLTPPCMGILNSSIAAVPTVKLATNIQASTYFLNLVTTNRGAQLSLRSAVSLANTCKPIYSVLPDAFDFLSFFTTDHLEYLPSTAAANFTAGRHFRLRISFTGTGSALYDIGNAYGSANRLKGLNIYDTLQRGIGDSRSAFHEYMHLWSAHTSTALGLTSDGSHYRVNCSADSVVGGFDPKYLTNGSTILVQRNCFQDNGAPPIDKYMMGLISTSAVPTLYIMTNYPGFNCGDFDFLLNSRPVTIADIVAVHGVRTPGPESAQRDFSIGFVAASHQRFLTATEMTYYDYLAEYFTRPLPPDTPAPNLWDDYVPISKYVGENVTWSSKGLGLIQPTITNLQWQANGFRVEGTGYPGRNYGLLGTTNLVSWVAIANQVVGTNGSFVGVNCFL